MQKIFGSKIATSISWHASNHGSGDGDSDGDGDIDGDGDSDGKILELHKLGSRTILRRCCTPPTWDDSPCHCLPLLTR